MLGPGFENSVDPDQLASEKPAYQDLQCFPLCLFCLFDLILYIPVNNLSIMSGQVSVFSKKG